MEEKHDPSATVCPDAGLLQAFSAGQLPEEILEGIGQHISECPSCGSMLQELHNRPSDDPIFVRLKECFQPQTLLDEDGFAQLDRAARNLEASTMRIVGPEATEPKPAHTPVLPVLREIPGYLIMKQIGEGGMGTVYRARQISVNREVALKMIRGASAAKRDTIIRFHREGEAIARLNHPHVVQLYDFGEHDGLPYFTMELITGGSLSSRLATGPMPWRDAVQLLAPLTQAMGAAHEQRIRHRDLKPGNILITAQGIPKISDFGLAKLADDDDQATCSETILGTPAYIAPEQTAGRINAFSPTVDIYAFGVILYECLTGRTPFRGVSKQHTLDLVRTAEPMPPSRLMPRLPRDLEAVCLKCLDKDPARRYASCQDLTDDLNRVLNGEPTVARPAGLVKRSWRRVRRHPVVALAAIILVTTLAALYVVNPQRNLEAVEADLQPGKRTVLIDKTGKPKWSKCIYGEGKSTFSLDPDGTYAVHAGDLCLLELLPDPRFDSYCLRAKVKHQMSFGFGGVGLYVGRKQFPGVEADLQSYVDMSYHDSWNPAQTLFDAKKLPPKQATTNSVRWERRIKGAYKGPWIWSSEDGLGAGPRFTPAGTTNPVWRDLLIIVTPTRLSGSWDGQPTPEMATLSIAEQTRKKLKILSGIRPDDPFIEAIDPEFSPRGGLGLYVYLGSASFCDVSVTPLNSSGASAPISFGKEKKE